MLLSFCADIKPENVLFSASGHLKLADFGTARKLAAEECSGSGGPGGAKRRGSFVGTAEYVSPEILKDQMPTTAADMWSFGSEQSTHQQIHAAQHDWTHA